MSFILDALRKSEHARQQQTGPGLAELPVAAAKPRTNAWATAAIALLVVNLLAVGILLLRRADREDEKTAAPAAAPAAVASTNAAVPPAANAEPAGPSLAPPTAAASAPVDEPPLQPPTGTASPASRPAAGRNPLAAEAGVSSLGQDPALTSAAATVPEGPPAVSRQTPAKRGSVVYAPVPGAMDAPYQAPADDPPAPTLPPQDAMPTADELAARGSVPALHLDLHVYATVPQQRFIFVNSRKYREGETLQEGPLIEKITPDGAVLNLRGSRFKLTSN